MNEYPPPAASVSLPADHPELESHLLDVELPSLPSSPGNESVSSVRKKLIDALEFEDTVEAGDLPFYSPYSPTLPIEDNHGGDPAGWQRLTAPPAATCEVGTIAPLPTDTIEGYDGSSSCESMALHSPDDYLRQEAVRLTCASDGLMARVLASAVETLGEMDRLLSDLRHWQGARREREEQDAALCASEAHQQQEEEGEEVLDKEEARGEGAGEAVGGAGREVWLEQLRLMRAETQAKAQLEAGLMERVRQGSERWQRVGGGEGEEEVGARLRQDVQRLRLEESMRLQERPKGGTQATPFRVDEGQGGGVVYGAGAVEEVMADGSEWGGRVLELEGDLQAYSSDIDLLLQHLQCLDERGAGARMDDVEEEEEGEEGGEGRGGQDSTHGSGMVLPPPPPQTGGEEREGRRDGAGSVG